MTLDTHAFNLPDRLAAKRDPRLIAADEEHFAAITTSIDTTIKDLERRLETELRAPGGIGQEAMDRDIEVRRLSGRLRAFGRYGLDLCLGRMVGERPIEHTDEAQPVYIGRLGLTDETGRRLLLDWRSPAAEPFFGATHGNPMGLRSRRRYRWTRGRVSDYWDEVFTPEGLEQALEYSRSQSREHSGRHSGGDRGSDSGAPSLEYGVALDDQSAFIASLGRSRSSRMRDVLSTIQADQDAIIRAGSRGALVVDGGPGTGKTVVALHRSAYLIYSEPRLARSRGGVLFVGPSAGYLSYVADVLPSLGEEGVQLVTLRDLVPEGRGAIVEPDATVSAVKAMMDVERVIERAVAFHEQPPTRVLTVSTEWADVQLDATDWAEAFSSIEPGTAHNEAREQVWEELLAIIADRHDEDVPPHLLRRALLQNDELRTAFTRAWPLLDPVGVVGDLWTVPEYLRACAPMMGRPDIAAVQRDDGRRWTVSDLPFLDAARQRIGDPAAVKDARRREAAVAARQESMSRVVDDLIAADDDGEGLVTMLRVEDAQRSLVDEAELPGRDPDLLAGPFAHIVVDEAQELTDADWGMLLRRCPSRSFTIVGDRAQARHGFTESWQARLERIGLSRGDVASLSINYRTPEEVMREAEPVIRTVIPDANVPTSVRTSGIPVRHGARSELETVLEEWLATNSDGVACVIDLRTAAGRTGQTDQAGQTDGNGIHGRLDDTTRISFLTPELSKGLEFDLVVLIDADGHDDADRSNGLSPTIEAAVDRYVAMTRATQRLVILS
ncbi:RNA polymerase recycling motor ATPase HelR [Plantibacter sp. YIM 135249]|uniref:RNA polymerase recycling motor ATPase HelR n=1 Tax=Plantibacter sp. YIM 135249 TaxID=3423918 RepID=UPI003D33960C